MKALSQFRAAYCSGLFILDAEAVTALSLLFEKVYLPNNMELVREFSKHYRFTNTAPVFPGEVKIGSDEDDDPFIDLPEKQRETAHRYLLMGLRFSRGYEPLFGEVFESEAYPNNEPLDVELIKKGGPGEKNTYRVTMNAATLSLGDNETFPRLIQKGYVPVVGKFHKPRVETQRPEAHSTKELASLLAMHAVQMVLPKMLPAHPEVILEARDRLSQHLPMFWSAMFKLSGELRKRIEGSASQKDIQSEAIDLVDTLVRPSLIELHTKIEKEKRDWFYKILSPVQKGIRLMIGNPPLTQQQLLTSALILASDTCMGVAENMRAIESLKGEAGLTYLLDLSQLLQNDHRKT